MSASRPSPLQGTRVLDLSRLLPGPLCAQHLADLGADVIKVEDNGLGDYAKPAVRKLANRGKRSIQINLKSPEGKDVFRRLVLGADVLIESFRPGTLARLGVGYEDLQLLVPRLVFCSITGYGQEGPRHDEVGHDLNYLALSGVLDQMGMKGDKPVIPGFLLGDIIGGTMSAAMGILAALVDVRSGGKGRYIDVAMTDALLTHSMLSLIEMSERGVTAEPGRGTHTGGTAQYNIYATRDGRHLAVAAQEKRFWDVFCVAIERPDLKAAHGTIGEESEPVKQAVAAAIMQRTLNEWTVRLAGLESCATPVLSYEEAIEDPQVGSRKSVSRIQGEYRCALPFRMTGLDVDLMRPSPVQGAHTRSVLQEIGYGQQELDELEAAGAIGPGAGEHEKFRAQTDLLLSQELS